MLSLICDDDTSWRRILERALGGTILSVDTIAEAITLTKKMQPHVVLLDVILPDGIGWEAIPTFRAASPHTEIVVMTAFARRTDGLRAIGEHHAFAYLDKSDGLDTIVRTVRRAFNSSIVGALRGAAARETRRAAVRR